jgi:hypothetical protein
LGLSFEVHEATCASKAQSPEDPFPTRAVYGRGHDHADALGVDFIGADRIVKAFAGTV